MEHPQRKVEEIEPPGLAEEAPKKRFVPTIIFMSFALNIGGLTLTLLTREIGATFFGSEPQVTVGITAQLSTIGHAAMVAAGLAMSVLAIRFAHKSFLLTGVTLQVVSAAGSFLAPTFLWLVVFAAIEGIGTVLAGVSIITLIGDFVPQDRKAKAVSYITTAVFLAMLAGSLIISPVARLGSWRYVYLLIALPFAAAALAASFFGVSSKTHQHKPEVRRREYSKTFKHVFSNRSAVACLVAGIFFTGAFGIFPINFLRQQFWSDLPMPIQAQYGSYVALVSTVLFAAGSLVAGRLANRWGVKALTVVGTFGDGIFIVLLFYSPSLWMALASNWLHVWFATTAITALTCLALDQVPKARGTMMALNSLFGNIGNTITPAVGGAMLVLASYQALGLVFGAMSMTACAVILVFAKLSFRKTQVEKQNQV